MKSYTVQQSKSTAKRFYVTILIGILLIFSYYTRRVTSPPNIKMVLSVVDQSKRPVVNATASIIGIGSFVTDVDGNVMVTVPAGVYDIIISWKSVYNPEPIRIGYAVVTLDESKNFTIDASVYNIELQVITPLGRRPIADANVYLSGVPLNLTSNEGKVFVKQVPSMYTETNPSYPVTVIWFGIDISPAPVTITSTKTYLLMADKIANLTMQVVGTQGQGVKAANVEIKNSAGMIIFNGISDEQGIVRVEVPWDLYNFTVYYQSYNKTQVIPVNSPIEIISLTTDLIVIFGQAITFTNFIMMFVMIIILFIVFILPLVYISIQSRKERKREEEERMREEEEEKKREVKYCLECGEKLELAGNYCIKCGAKQDRLEDREERYCPECGEKLMLDAKYCVKCGIKQQDRLEET